MGRIFPGDTSRQSWQPFLVFGLVLIMDITMHLPLVEFSSLAIEILAVVIIVGAVFFSTANYLYSVRVKKSPKLDLYQEYKQRLGRTLLLGLEILIAADVVRTVALEPTIRNVTTLGLLVVVRTFLSWSLVVEIEGRWPWQSSAKQESFDC